MNGGHIQTTVVREVYSFIASILSVMTYTFFFFIRKKYSDKADQDVVKKILEETKGQDATVSHLHVRGKK